MKERVDRERRGDKSEREMETTYDRRCSVLQMHEFGAKLLGKDLTKVDAFLNDIPDPMLFAMNARLLVPAKKYSEGMKTPYETGYWCQVCNKYIDDNDIFSRTTSERKKRERERKRERRGGREKKREREREKTITKGKEQRQREKASHAAQ